MSRKKKYNKSWESNYLWLKPVFGDVYSAHCTYCKQNLNITNKGVTALTIHEETTKHEGSKKSYGETQRTFTEGTVLSPNKITFTKDELVTKAEIIEALKTVETNRSFASANGDNLKYANQFPDSAIAKSYQQGETKIKYNIQYGLAPYVRQLFKKEYSGKPFTFKFDETTNSHVKKQYDGYITFYSDVANKITTFYCGSLFVGHCTADDLLDHFYHFMETLDLNADLLFGMDGPNVNKSFERKLVDDLKKRRLTIYIQ